MKWNFSEDTLKSILLRIMEKKIDLENQLEMTEYNKGVLDGYTQCLEMIKHNLEVREFRLEEFTK